MSKVVKLGDIAIFQTGPFGTQFKASEYTKEGIPVINVKNIGYGSILTNDLDFISIHTKERLKSHILNTGDIVVGRKGSVDRHAYITEEYNGWVQGSDCIRVRCRKGINSQYISHQLKLDSAKKQINVAAVGSTMASLNTDILKNIKILLPEKFVQDKIELVLSVIEKKLQLNNKINETLQKQAKDIYMHLFFRKTPNGKIADILSENEKSTIQVGEAKVATGNYPFFTSGEAILEWEEALVGGRNAFLNTGGNADVKFYVGDAAYSTDTWCIAAKNALSDYLYLLLSSIKVELNQKFFQGTGLKHLQKELLKDRPIYIPDEIEINAFNKTICPMFDMISEKTRETQELIALRDWLLPMLMNGQATVAEDQRPVLRVIENDTKNEQPNRFALWLQNQGLAARGNIDRQTLREIFDAMDEDDK